MQLDDIYSLTYEPMRLTPPSRELIDIVTRVRKGMVLSPGRPLLAKPGQKEEKGTKEEITRSNPRNRSKINY